MEPKHYIGISLSVALVYGILYLLVPKFRKISIFEFEGMAVKVLGISVLVCVVALIFLEAYK